MRIIICLLLMIIAGNVYAWSDKKTTHLFLSDYVITNYFSPDLYKSKVNGQEFKYWILEGADLEDQGDNLDFATGKARSLNHFHNPTKPIAEAGLTDLPLPYLYGKSTMKWAQDADYQATKVGGDWSWNTVRTLYYKYLTTSDKTIRESWQSDYLKGLGYQMHLLEDMSQPNHVRNDTHLADGSGKSPKYGFETWAVNNELKIRNILDAATIPTVTVNLFPKLGEDASLAPVARLFDTRNVSNGVIIPSMSMSQGLAEYTNANFFSEDTTFADGLSSGNKQYFPYPRKAETNLQNFIDNNLDVVTATDVDGSSYANFKINKQNTTGVSLECLAKPGPNTKKYYNEFGEGSAFYTSFHVDEECFEEYAKHLFPRSVAYSKALLDYFFRGKLEASLSTLNQSTSSTMRLMIKNATPGEQMTGGKLALVLRYRQFTETGTTLVQPVQNADFSYMVIELQSQTVSSDTASEYTFPLPQPLPLWTKDLAAQVVYQGTLGNETDAVAVSPWYPLQYKPEEIELKLPAAGVYAATTGVIPFTEIRLNARNNLPTGEIMTDGTISLYLLYRTATDDPFQSVEVTSLPADSYSLVKVSEKNNIRTLPTGSAVELVFDLSIVPLPLWATDVYLYVVYQGTLTNGVTTTPNATVVGMIDISEPTPVDIFNNTDYSCIGSQWYHGGTSAAISAADQIGNINGLDDETDTYPHSFTNIYAKMSSTANPVTASATDYTFLEQGPIDTGSIKRLGYVLTDYAFKYSFIKTWNHTSPDGWSTNETAMLFDGTAVKNQTDPDGNNSYPGMYNIRGKLMWWGAGRIFDNIPYPNGNITCEWGLLPLP